MSTDTEPPSTKISLRYDEKSEEWLARDDITGITARAPTREAALTALDEAIANHAEKQSSQTIDADDPFFTAPSYNSGKNSIAKHADEYLAEDSYRDKISSDSDSA